jgi:hypothetical protein
MPNPVHSGNNEIPAIAAHRAAPIGASDRTEFLNPRVDKTGIVIGPDRPHHDLPQPIAETWSPREFSVQKPAERDGQNAQQVAGDVQAEANQASQPPRETCFLARLLRVTGAAFGFLVGGPAGACVGSMVGELAGDIAAEQSTMILRKLGRGFF